MSTVSAGSAPRRDARTSSSAVAALASSFGASIGIQLLTVVSGVVLARTLGPAGRGELTAVMLWPASLAALGSIGVVEATAYFVALGRERLGAILGTVSVMGLAQSAVLVGIGATIVPAVFTGAKHGALGSGYLFLAFIPLNLAALYFMAVLNGREQFTAFNVLRISSVFGATLGIVVLAAVGSLGVFSATAVYVCANSATVLGATLALSGRSVRPFAFDRNLARRIIGFGIRSHTSSVSSALNERLDQLLISLFLLPRQLGLYVIAVTLTSATSLVGSSVSLFALPAIARADSKEREVQLSRLLVLVTAAAAIVITVPMVVLVPELLRIFFGHSFLPAAGVSRVLLIAGVLLSLNRTLSALLKGMGRPLDAGTAEFIALGFTIAGLGVLLPTLGLMGAAIASLLAYTVSMTWMLRRAGRSLDLTPGALLIPGRTDMRALRRALRASETESQVAQVVLDEVIEEVIP